MMSLEPRLFVVIMRPQDFIIKEFQDRQAFETYADTWLRIYTTEGIIEGEIIRLVPQPENWPQVEIIVRSWRHLSRPSLQVAHDLVIKKIEQEQSNA